MKLKIFLFPIVLIISISISIWIIKPDFSIIQNKKKELSSRLMALENIKDKQKSIGSLIGSLDSNSEKERLILDYLPQIRHEEEVLNKIYHISIDSGVSLISFSLADGNSKNNSSEPAVQREEEIESLGFYEEGDLMLQTSSPKTISAQVSILGTYRNIRKFLSQINRMDKINNIYTVSISQSGDASSEEGEISVSTDNLSASISLDFDYLRAISVSRNSNLPVFSKQKFDFSINEKLEEFISKKVPVVEVSSAGKDNPFIPD